MVSAITMCLAGGAGTAQEFRGNSLGSGAWIRGRDDRSPHDEIPRAGGDRIGRAQGPRLVVLRVVGTANAWRDDCEIASASLPDDRDFLRGRDDTIQSGRLRQCG